MSFLDMDERLIDLVARVDIVYSPLVDTKTLPEHVDIGILEGSISSEDDLEKAREFRKHCKILVSLGDCAVNGNVPAMRNHFKLKDVVDRAYIETVDLQAQIPTRGSGAAVRRETHPRCRPGRRLRSRAVHRAPMPSGTC
jgi:NAD-reducing hydrogenase small subunit